MRLFDKYLLSIVDQRIPMPTEWQESLKLSMSNNTQSQISADESHLVPLHGYNFQQSDVLERGYIFNEVRTYDFNSSQDLRYLLHLYLRAIKDYTGKNYMPYLPVSVSQASSESLLYDTTAPIIFGQTYSLYARTSYPMKVEVYLSGVLSEPIFSKIYRTVSPVAPIIFKTSRDWLNFEPSGSASKQDYSYAEEYATLKISTDAPVVVLPGSFSPLNAIKGLENWLKLNIPSAGYSMAPYADKLIPNLLGINCPSDPPQELVDQMLSRLGGSDIKKAVIDNTLGIYDVDENMGGKLQW